LSWRQAKGDSFAHSIALPKRSSLRKSSREVSQIRLIGSLFNFGIKEADSLDPLRIMVAKVAPSAAGVDASCTV
jgi:hypothetical protein